MEAASRVFSSEEWVAVWLAIRTATAAGTSAGSAALVLWVVTVGVCVGWGGFVKVWGRGRGGGMTPTPNADLSTVTLVCWLELGMGGGFKVAPGFETLLVLVCD